jgi:AraC family transcriptional regulator, regulatory protein of adaptative response / methylated-DNA-[protein]-cysteine methyltransferase
MSRHCRRRIIRFMTNRDHRTAINRACRRIETADTPPTLAALAHEADLSPWHFQRIFTATVGVSPKRYAMAQRQQRLDRKLRSATSVTDAIYDAGYAASSAAYRDSKTLGMAPRALRSGGANEQIHYATATTSLGPILVATTERGICMVEFGSKRDLLPELVRRFPKAQIKPAEATTVDWLTRTVQAIDHPMTDSGLALDIRGTAFQIKVWNALTRLKSGDTISYGELARRIRAPSSTRAVARACATNGIAVLVPCHRVVSATGKLTGYKWGIDRKQQLLESEATVRSATSARQPKRQN